MQPQQQRSAAGGGGGNNEPRVFNDFAIFKAKTACKMSIVKPVFEQLANGEGLRGAREGGGAGGRLGATRVWLAQLHPSNF